MRLEPGAHVRTNDGADCVLSGLVVDPARARVTDLVVEPHHRHALARLVPFRLARPDARAGELVLDCSRDRIRAMTPVAEIAYLGIGEQPRQAPDSDIGVDDVFVPPRLGYSDRWAAPWPEDPQVWVAYDRIPKGETEVRAKSLVLSKDGRRVGDLEALEVDDDGDVAEVVAGRGHLWWRRRFTVRAEAVARFGNDAIDLRLGRDAVGVSERRPAAAGHRGLEPRTAN